MGSSSLAEPHVVNTNTTNTTDTIICLFVA